MTIWPYMVANGSAERKIMRNKLIYQRINLLILTKKLGRQFLQRNQNAAIQPDSYKETSTSNLTKNRGTSYPIQHEFIQIKIRTIGIGVPKWWNSDENYDICHNLSG